MKKEKLYEVFMGLIPFLLIMINHIFFFICNRPILSDSSFVPFQSIIIVYTIFLFLIFLTKSYKKANIILIIISFIVTTINQIKIFYMQEPIYLSDIKLLGSLGDVFKITDGTYGSLSKYLLLFIIKTLILTGIFIFAKRYKEKEQKRNYYFIIPIILLIILSLPIKGINNLVKGTFHSDSFKDYTSVSSNLDYYKVYGFTGGMYFNILDSRIFKPDNYNKEEIDKVLNYQSDNNMEADYNIILVFSESFFDITKLDEIEFNKDILSSYHELESKGKLISMITPTYGGRSCNVEFELLTSNNLSYYDISYIPYLYFNKKDFNRYDNFLTTMKDSNIVSTSYITTSDNLYNVGNVYNYLGFTNKIENREEDINTKFIPDKYVTDRIIEYTNNENNKFFLFATTMQNHMPYKKDKYSNYNVSIKNSKLDDDSNEAILSYAQGLYEAGNELKRLYEYINTIDKKTIIVFLGDHLPYLSNQKGDNLIDKLDYFNTDDANLNLYRKYNTEALILSNFDIEFDDTKYLSPDLLVPYLLKTLKVKMNSYYDYLINESKEILPSYNKYVAMDKEGNIYSISELPDNMKKEYNLRHSLQYNLYYE